MRRRELLSALALLPFLAGPVLAGEGKSKTGGVGYIRLPTLTATIVRSDGRRGVLSVEAGVDTPDAKLREKVTLLTPRLRDAFNSTLMVYGNNLRPGDPPDLDHLETLLQADADRVVGRPGARVLLGTTLIN